MGSVAAAGFPEATGTPAIPENMAAARSLSAGAASSATASGGLPVSRSRIASRCRGVDQRLLDAITCEWKCADPWKPRAEATGGKANVAHLSCCQQLLLKNSAVHGHPQVVRLVSVCGMGQHQLSRLQRTPVLSTTACQVPPWWPRQGQRQKARTKVGTARGGSQRTIPHPTCVSNSGCVLILLVPWVCNCCEFG